MSATATRILHTDLGTPSYHTTQHMDPVSSIVGLVTFGFTVFKKVDAIKEVIRAAPGQLRALQILCKSTELLLHKLQKVQECMPYDCDRLEIESFRQLYGTVECCLKEVDAAITKVGERTRDSTNVRGKLCRYTVHWWRWYFKTGEVENVTRELKAVQESLSMMIDFTKLHFLEQMITGTGGSHPCNCSEHDAADEINSSVPMSRDKALPCLPQCECSFHRGAITALPMLPASHSSPLPMRHFASDGVQTHREDTRVPPKARGLRPPTNLSLPLHSNRPLCRRSASSPCVSRNSSSMYHGTKRSQTTFSRKSTHPIRPVHRLLYVRNTECLAKYSNRSQPSQILPRMTRSISMQTYYAALATPHRSLPGSI